MLGLGSTVTHIERFLSIQEPDPMLLEGFMREIQLRFDEDLGKHVYLQLRPDVAAFFEDSIDKRWRPIADRFKCDFDIAEARQCIGLERPTAAVFHLMKVVEAAVLELQMFLKTRDMKAHFGSVLQRLEHVTQKEQFEHLPEHLKPYKQFMVDVLAQLHAVKDSWRNKVTHVDANIVPVGLFTEEMARGIHDATLLLLEKMASGLPAREEEA